MSHLDPEARKILSLARAARTPSATDKQRVRRRIALAGATSIAAATAADVAHASQAAVVAKPALGLFGSVKLYVAGATLVLAVAGYAILPGTEQRPATVPIHAAAQVPFDAPPTVPAAVSSPQAAAVTAIEREDSSSVSALRVQPLAASNVVRDAGGVTAERAVQARAAVSGSLGRELDLLHGAQAAWRARDSAKVLSLLDQHARKYPKSELRDERGALRVLALCELGRGREARRLGQALIRRAPSSPVRATIEESCAFQ